MPIMKKRLGWVLAPMLMLAAVSLSADDRAPKPASGSKTTTIVGTAWNADYTPIKGAHLRLRNVVTGKIVSVTKANAAGEFTFDNVEPGSYVIELVSDSDRVEAIGNVFTIGPGETVATFVRLGSTVRGVAGLFSNTAANVAV